MIKDILLSERNKRIEEKNRLLDEKMKQLDKINEELDRQIKLQDEESKKLDILEKKYDKIIDKEKQLMNYKYIIQLSDGRFELAREDEVDIVDKEDIIVHALRSGLVDVKS